MQRGSTIDAGPSPAEVYDERFVPALFGQWGPVIAGLAGVSPGSAVLDVACGTGALAVAAAERAAPGGQVVGLDANPEMLAVARRKPVDVRWIEARAEALPFADASFDAVVSQFGLMFFEDPARALGEMRRVLRPGGRMAVAVCDAVERSDGYAAFTDLLRRLFGDEVAEAFARPFALGDPDRLGALCAEAGIPDASVERVAGEVRFPSIADLVSTERACAWTLGGVLDDAQFGRLREEAETELRPFRDSEGRVSFTMPALVIAATRRD